MLAGTETVHPMVGATTGVQRLIERTDLHLVNAAAGRRHTEAAKIRRVRLQRFDPADLGPATPPAALDFLGVARQPADQRWRALDAAVLATAGRRAARVARAVRPRNWRGHIHYGL